ncbi:hypothetical protein NBM50_05555 [Xylophilus ampelinus]|uniref:Uncharacterized protein n=2 Tax=Xylophilus ampelinus TaxID=54067 RepID=A0A318SIG9_9BURK|nr:hypothetical protein [Xylophilus ampelinus]PYE78744.1 hypothetical protein DFQ15_105103 [Xylophilus ampelinus]
MIQQHRASPSDRGNFRLSDQQLGSATFMDSQAYHQRIDTDAPFFFGEYATEQPSLSMVREMPQDKQDYYAVRHAGKRGRDLFTDEPIEGGNSKIGKLKTSPLLSTQKSGTRAIRGFAATATIDQSRGAYIARLHDHVVNAIGRPEGQVVHLVRPARDYYVADNTLNFFTFCQQAELASTLNALEAQAAKREGRPALKFSDNKCLVGLSRTSRTEATPIGRLVQQPFFTTSELQPGDKVIISDDHIQAGGSMLAMNAAAQGAGADVLAIATLSSHPLSPQLAMAPEVAAFLDQTLAAWDPENLVASRLAELGMPRDRLTNSEAMILIAYAIDPTDTQAVEKFEKMQARFFRHAHFHNVGIDPDAPDADGRMERLAQRQENAGTASARSFIGNARVLEGEHDSLTPILKQHPKTPQEVVDELDQVSKSSRKSVQGSEVKQVIVLDWDDCLRDEKGLNYQLMHNALAVAAKEHAKTLPEIGEVLERMRNRAESGIPAGEGDPLLMRSQEDFTHHLMANPGIFKRHVVEDFVNAMGLPPDKEGTVVNAVYAEFNRQYRALMRSKPEDKRGDLPFPDVQFSLMPGAREFLEKCRTPESRVVLISNRGHGELEDEVNHLGMAHYFDVVSGIPVVTRDRSDAQPAQMPEDLQRRLTQNLRCGDLSALREVLDEVADYAHPNTTAVGRFAKKPDVARLLDALAHLSVQPDVPITSYGDQTSDVQQLTGLAGQGRRLEGVIINPQRSDVGQQIEVDGVPTRVIGSLNDI